MYEWKKPFQPRIYFLKREQPLINRVKPFLLKKKKKKKNWFHFYAMDV